MKVNLFTSALLAATIFHSTVSTAPAEKCPEVFDPSQLVFFPHPTDCAKFYFCGHSGPVEKSCPPGLHWNSNANVCDWQALAGCGPEGSMETSSATTVVNTSTPGTVSSTNAPVTTSAPCATSTASPTKKCPDVLDPNHTTFMPHADCSKFYVCTSVGPIERDCPAGLHWSQQASVCDWPDVAGCVASEAEARETVGQCPELYDPDNEVFLAHSSDCSKFLICTWGGVPVVHNCPVGLHWNRDSTQCDWPALAGCAVFDRDTRFSRQGK